MNLNSVRASFLTLLEIVIVLAIVLFLAQKMTQVYFNKPIADKQAEGMAQEAGINTGNYRSVVQSTKDKMQSITEQRQNDLESFGDIK